MPFSSQTLSIDSRTIGLVRLAVNLMTKVTTLRILMGHPSINDALLRCFFAKHRVQQQPIRKLWLENCRISAGCNVSIVSHVQDLPLELDFAGLESIRFRRLPMRAGYHGFSLYAYKGMVHARLSLLYNSGSSHTEMQDSAGAQYHTGISTVVAEQEVGVDQVSWAASVTTDTEGSLYRPMAPLQQLFIYAHQSESEIYDALRPSLAQQEIELLDGLRPPSSVSELVLAYRGSYLDPPEQYQNCMETQEKWQRERRPSADVAIGLLQSASRTLTSLTFDWVFTKPQQIRGARDVGALSSWIGTFVSLFDLRFPRLRAFQFRNAIAPDTALPRGLCLLDHSCIYTRAGEDEEHYASYGVDTACAERIDLAGLGFMEAHPNIECLAWPMAHFFRPQEISSDIRARVEAVISNLGRTLTDLRVDALYAGDGEPFTHESTGRDLDQRASRRLFIEMIAAKMTNLKQIKIEGGVPRDERREIIRAIHACPLQKIVMIGVCSPLGNTWGPHGFDIEDHITFGDGDGLEEEDKNAIWKLGFAKPSSLPETFRFDPEYGWPASPPMLSTIARFHADRITELKFCGSKGAPALLMPTPITTPMLSALKHFHNLESLTLSIFLSTMYEGSPCDSEILAYWENTRSSTSTALVTVPSDAAEPSGWARQLTTNYAPDALAQKVTVLLGPLLSERAKARAGGVQCRASFNVGYWTAIYDLDVRVGLGEEDGRSVCLGFVGPRHELEGERYWGKLRSRRWF
ncbi:hypothetical protein LTR62_006889 [Meristemomyces frigidus]|uniref:Uncharacterized protein n=1 Tax=Meristemomyces frigidus TaxID=1508187 RepID=A0AAN7YE56_9PEZI|nr:hypothetical protein LTR62_006889 [Meristemomyces frigidus]